MDTISKGLSSEQLLDYIKKQKARIKRLEKENEVLRKDKEARVVQSHALAPAEKQPGFDPLLFWELVGRETPFIQNIARSALNSMVFSLCVNGCMNRKTILHSGDAKRKLFQLWKVQTLQMRSLSAEKVVDELKSNLTASEQRISKLKALLARTHQANQRNLEDTAASKKATQDVSIELNSLKQKEELERVTMLESLRVQSIDSAFQYDVELSIQRAAEQMVSQQQIVQSNSQQTARRIKELEEERSLLNMQLESLQEEERGNELRTLSLNNEIDQLQRKLRESETARFESEARITCLHQQLEFEEMQRRDVEGELAATLSSQVKQLQETEAKSDTKATIKINAITQELHEMSSRLDSSERSGRVLQHEIDKLEADLRRNRGHAEELEAASNEIGRLNRMINELRDSRHLPAPRHLPCELPDRRCGLHPREGGCSDHRPGGQCVRMAGGGLQ
jgi:hypothetical protein